MTRKTIEEIRAINAIEIDPEIGYKLAAELTPDHEDHLKRLEDWLNSGKFPHADGVRHLLGFGYRRGVYDALKKGQS